MENSKLINGDCLEELKKIDDDTVDLLCTDPPYGYGFMGKHWDTFQEKQSTKSQSVGWMSPGMTKSTYGMREFFIPIWKEALRVVKPGGFALVMSAPRSDVQTVMVQTLQEAGFDVSFSPIYWAYATGFPKAMNISKAVAKRGDIDEAKKLDGSYAGYQPKPAVEVVIVAMKPLEKKGYLDQALDNGHGITWLDSCRIPFAGMSDMDAGWWGITKEEQSEALSKYHIDHKGYDDGSYSGNRSKDKEHYMKSKGDKENYTDERGWDQWGLSKDYEKYKKDNVGSQENFDTEPEGLSRGNQPSRKKGDTYERVSAFGDSTQCGFKSEENDTAEASPLGRFAANLVVSDDVLEEDFSRYYSLDAWWRDRFKRLPEEIQRTFPFLVVPKASKREKNEGCDGMEEKYIRRDDGQPYGMNTNKFRPDGSERKEVLPKKNSHPTVKPIDLMSYLVVLGSRKGDVVLDPFAGSGTTGIACVFSERNYILIEREKEYYDIMEARIKKAKNPADLVQHEWF